MTTIEEIKNEASKFVAGANVKVRGLASSSGDIRDVDMELLDADAYKNMQKESLDILRDALEKLSGSAHEACVALIAAREKSLLPAAEDSAPRGPRYVGLGDSALATLADASDAVYILRVKTKERQTATRPKGELPAAKFDLERELDLPTLSYTHVIKLVDGKFESVTFN
jgi:hypothetical protein